MTGPAFVRAVALAVLLLAPIALAQEGGATAWNQPGGDPQRSRTALLARDRPLDVLATGSFLDANEGLGGGPVYSMRAVETPSGMVALATGVIVSDQTTPCTLIRLTELVPMRAERVREEPCPNARFRLLGAHPEAGLVLVSRAGARAEVALEALDMMTLESRWRAFPTAALASTPAVLQRAWSVKAVVEDDRIVAAFSSTEGESILCAFSLVGEELWCRPVSTTAFFTGTDLDPIIDPRQFEARGFQTDGIVGVEGGYVLFGEQPGRGAAAIWTDTEGEAVSGYLEGLADCCDGAPPVGQGELAAFHNGTAIFAANVRDAAVAGTPTAIVPDGNGMVWWRDLVAISFGEGVAVLRAPGFTDDWTWRAPKPDVDDQIVTPEGQLVVLTEGSSATRDLELSWLDLTRRAETRRLPLPSIPAQALEAVGASLLPLSDGRLFVVTASGTYFLLGAAADDLVPDASVDDAYPRPGEPITLDARGPPGTTSLRVSWGDGTFNAPDGPIEHSFTENGPRVVHVTAVLEDGRTATRILTVDVGGTPPVRLTAVQRAFSPENQELTFFLLGLAFTGGGVLLAAVLRGRRQSNLARETRRLHELQDLAARDPPAGLAALEEHRRHLEDAHTRRKLDDAHFALLDARTIRAMRATRLRLLGETVNQLTPHFRGLLDTALEDGRISPGELTTLLAALTKERIEPSESERLRALLAGWAR